MALETEQENRAAEAIEAIGIESQPTKAVEIQNLNRTWDTGATECKANTEKD